MVREQKGGAYAPRFLSWGRIADIMVKYRFGTLDQVGSNVPIGLRGPRS